jgi:uncharacterized protein YecE (DUF72 family)
MTRTTPSLHIGTAGWGLPRAVAEAFPGDGALLERYARVLGCTEINTTFSRTHRADTFERWAMQTPTGFRFSVKLPKAFTHVARLKVPSREVGTFVSSLAGLGERLAVLLVQLPPSLGFDPEAARDFFRSVRAENPGAVVYCSWHGSPRMYWSAYDDDWLEARARELLNWPATTQVWCIFDNTAAGAAADDALRLAARMARLSA